MGVTVTSVNKVAMSAAEQVCLRTITLDLTHSGRLGGVTECTTCYSNSTYVYVCVCVHAYVCVQQQWVHVMCIVENCETNYIMCFYHIFIYHEWKIQAVCKPQRRPDYPRSHHTQYHRSYSYTLPLCPLIAFL